MLFFVSNNVTLNSKDKSYIYLCHTPSCASPLERYINGDEIRGNCSRAHRRLFFTLTAGNVYRSALLNTYWMSNKPVIKCMSTISHKSRTLHPVLSVLSEQHNLSWLLRDLYYNLPLYTCFPNLYIIHYTEICPKHRNNEFTLIFCGNCFWCDWLLLLFKIKS